ncbi:MAG: hypothetical protein JNL83_08790 [Myxococcales bacterium]|nr:hypothetical protein [Myxococcales bacterium]
MRFHALEGDRDALRAVLAKIASTRVAGITARPPWPKIALDGVGIEAADMLVLEIALISGRVAQVQLLVTRVQGLIVNDLSVTSTTGLEEPTANEKVELMTVLFTQCLVPAFEAVPDVVLVVERDGARVRLGPANRPRDN